MKIAIIGAGNVGRAVGGAWLRAGHTIAYGVRAPHDPKHGDLGGTTVAPVAEAIAGADVILLAVHWDAVAEAIAACGDLTGRILIDATNPLSFTDAGMELAFGFDTSAAERIAAMAPGARVVKALNQVGAGVMANARGRVTPPVMFVASDHDGARATVTALVRELGFDARNGGPLKTARLLEPLAMLWIDQVYARGADPLGAFAFLGAPSA